LTRVLNSLLIADLNRGLNAALKPELVRRLSVVLKPVLETEFGPELRSQLKPGFMPEVRPVLTAVLKPRLSSVLSRELRLEFTLGVTPLLITQLPTRILSKARPHSPKLVSAVPGSGTKSHALGFRRCHAPIGRLADAGRALFSPASGSCGLPSRDSGYPPCLDFLS